MTNKLPPCHVSAGDLVVCFRTGRNHMKSFPRFQSFEWSDFLCWINTWLNYSNGHPSIWVMSLCSLEVLSWLGSPQVSFTEHEFSSVLRFKETVLSFKGSRHKPGALGAEAINEPKPALIDLSRSNVLTGILSVWEFHVNQPSVFPKTCEVLARS